MSDAIESVDEYLERRRRGSTQLDSVPIRMPPAMHTHLLIIAKQRGESMNTIALMMLQRGYERLVQEWDAEDETS